MTWEEGIHPPGFYRAYPEVTWDMAAERWHSRGYLLVNGRTDVLLARCRSCDWKHDQLVVSKPERLRVAEFIVECQHWYSCESGRPEVEVYWLSQ